MVIDSVMPKKNGGAVYDEIRKIDSHVKVVSTAGYTGDVILHKGIEENRSTFCQNLLYQKNY